MAIEDEGELIIARIIQQVKTGTPIVDVLKRGKCFNWYYRYATTAQKALVKQASVEAISKQQIENKFGISIVSAEIDIDKKCKFQDLCVQQKTNVSRRISMLITNDLNANYSNLV